jgi:hypothetical protein
MEVHSALAEHPHLAQHFARNHRTAPIAACMVMGPRAFYRSRPGRRSACADCRSRTTAVSEHRSSLVHRDMGGRPKCDRTSAVLHTGKGIDESRQCFRHPDFDMERTPRFGSAFGVGSGSGQGCARYAGTPPVAHGRRCQGHPLVTDLKEVCQARTTSTAGRSGVTRRGYL